jgi:hypothetical protein
MATRSSTDLALVLPGLLAWVAAAVLAVALPTTEAELPTGTGGKVTVQTPNIVAAGAAGGFAVAGGLCLLGAALVARGDRRDGGP